MGTEVDAEPRNGRGRGHAAGQGAKTDGPGKGAPAFDRARQQDCKSILIANEVFAVLKGVQNGSDPRLEIRYLVEAAIEMAQAHPDFAVQLQRQARDRLRRHLAQFD